MNDAKPITEIPLGDGHVAIVYSDTYKRLGLRSYPRWKPYTVRGKYTYAVSQGIFLAYLHRVIMGAKKGEFVDHKNQNTLDCRDDNLRIATRSQNAANSEGRRRHNSSGFKGVTWSQPSRKWAAKITKDGWRYHLGVFQHKHRAAIAVDRAALALFGEFAGLNFPGRKTKPVKPKGGFPVGRRRANPMDDPAFF